MTVRLFGRASVARRGGVGGELQERFRVALRASALGAAALIAVPAAATAGDTLADALAKAYVNDPSLDVARAGLRVADEGVRQERSSGLGRVEANSAYGYSNAGGDNTRRGRDDADPFSLGITGAISIYDGGQTANGVRSAQETVNRTRADLENTEQDVLLSAATAYLDVQRDRNLVSLARNNVRVISEQLRAARDRFEVGEVTRTDVSQAEARLAAARSDLASNIGALERSRQAYLAVVGELPDDLARLPPIPDLPDDEDAAIALSQAYHPELQSARFDVRRAEFEVKRAVGRRLPSVTLEGSANYANNALRGDDGALENDSFDLTVRGSVPIWTGGLTPSQIREAQARLAQAQAEIHDSARRLRQETSNAWADLRVARTSINAARQQIRAAQIAFDGVQEEATLGARTTLDVLDAEQELLAARSDLVSSQRDEYVAAYQLLSAIGRLTVRHLGLNVDAYDPNAYPASVQEDPFDYPRDESTEWSRSWRP